MRRNEKPFMWLSITRVFRSVAWISISPHHVSCLICTCSPGWKRIDVSSNPTTDRQLRNCWNQYAPWLWSRQSIHRQRLHQETRIPPVRGLTETPLFVHIYTGGCRIYSQSAISKTPSLTHYLLYTRIPWYCICLCEVLSTTHSHLYTFLNTTYSCAVLGLSSTQ